MSGGQCLDALDGGLRLRHRPPDQEALDCAGIKPDRDGAGGQQCLDLGSEEDGVVLLGGSRAA